MRRAERLFRLVQDLRSRNVTRAEDLARRFEVSLSTIYRDIAHLQGSGLPIEGEAGVGYMLRPGFDLPATTFTHEQIEALAVGLAFVERTGDTDLAAAAREVRAKIQSGLPLPEDRALSDAPFFNLHGKPPSDPHAGLMRAAIRQKRVVEISYANGAGPATTRRIQPLVIWTLPEGWMVSGWCELREDFRTFRADRIAALCVTKVTFPDDPGKGLQAFMATENCHD